MQKGAPYAATMTEARQRIEEMLTNQRSKPPLLKILAANDVLNGLSMRSSKAMWMQLVPKVFCANEVVCSDVFTSDAVFFLSKGKLLYSNGKSKDVAITTPAACVGLNALVCHEQPTFFDEKRQLIAPGYCELWMISVHALQCLWEDADMVSCTRIATRKVQQALNPTLLYGPLRAVPAFNTITDGAVQQIAKCLRSRVYSPNECIVPARKPPKFGVLVVCGRFYLATSAKSEKREYPRCGIPFFPCEALTSTAIPVGVYAETSVIVLQITSGTILDGLDSQEDPTNSMEAILESAEKYINQSYGEGQSSLSKAQNEAIQRVKEFNEKARVAAHAKPTALSVTTPEERETAQLMTENKLLTSLALQLEFLRFGHDAADVEHYQYFRDVSEPAEKTVSREVESRRESGGGAERHRGRQRMLFY
ncbi:hypothetical protein AGDE_04258 [Angomonas deanei]|uniref:Cyclic nucleotide-binding domain containing protein n=1 Tax=Angomonas deanei TaxID=59799 RepID=A0A7G2CLQ7_9TRYP|nr:hypothetical protein AGDE_04258 [Angomonas deanei]CAD2220359.1 hypothetical protein, conserved [Angomonas deanei]|eukprot:EPY39670.1 hypothetical protein AGDE_04258 [Angomonas deanei]